VKNASFVSLGNANRNRRFENTQIFVRDALVARRRAGACTYPRANDTPVNTARAARDRL